MDGCRRQITNPSQEPHLAVPTLISILHLLLVYLNSSRQLTGGVVGRAEYGHSLGPGFDTNITWSKPMGTIIYRPYPEDTCESERG